MSAAIAATAWPDAKFGCIELEPVVCVPSLAEFKTVTSGVFSEKELWTLVYEYHVPGALEVLGAWLPTVASPVRPVAVHACSRIVSTDQGLAVYFWCTGHAMMFDERDGAMTPDPQGVNADAALRSMSPGSGRANMNPDRAAPKVKLPIQLSFHAVATRIGYAHPDNDLMFAFVLNTDSQTGAKADSLMVFNKTSVIAEGALEGFGFDADGFLIPGATEWRMCRVTPMEVLGLNRETGRCRMFCADGSTTAPRFLREKTAVPEWETTEVTDPVRYNDVALIVNPQGVWVVSASRTLYSIKWVAFPFELPSSAAQAEVHRDDIVVLCGANDDKHRMIYRFSLRGIKCDPRVAASRNKAVTAASPAEKPRPAGLAADCEQHFAVEWSNGVPSIAATIWQNRIVASSGKRPVVHDDSDDDKKPA